MSHEWPQGWGQRHKQLWGLLDLLSQCHKSVPKCPSCPLSLGIPSAT